MAKSSPLHKISFMVKVSMLTTWVCPSKCSSCFVVFVFFIAILLVLLSPLVSFMSDIIVHGSKNDVIFPIKQKIPIPRHIHQIWLGNVGESREPPDKYQAYAKYCQMLNPGYNYTLWSNNDIEKLLETHYEWFLPTYKNYRYPLAQKPDAGRYFILYHLGGVYVDTDIECKVPFDDVMKNTSKDTGVVLAATNPLGYTTNFMMSIPHHPFMHDMITTLINTDRWYLTPHWTVMMSAGPLHVYRTYSKYPFKNHIHILSVEQHKNILHHEQAKTWHQWDGKIMVLVDRYSYPLIYFGLILLTAVCLKILHVLYLYIMSR